MKSIFLSHLLFCLLLFSSISYAEGNCPEGYYPIGGSGAQGCAPVPGNNMQQGQQSQPTQLPPARWESRWGAIATYEPNGSLGAVIGMLDKESAEKSALAICKSKHGSACKIQMTYANQCIAMVVGGKIFNVNSGASVEDAAKKGMSMCSVEANDCHVYYSACSLSVRTQ